MIGQSAAMPILVRQIAIVPMQPKRSYSLGTVPLASEPTTGTKVPVEVARLQIA